MTKRAFFKQTGKPSRPVLHKVILTYLPGERRTGSKSVWKTEGGLEDARRFAAEWGAFDHVATVRIYRGRTLIETTKDSTKSAGVVFGASEWRDATRQVHPS